MTRLLSSRFVAAIAFAAALGGAASAAHAGGNVQFSIGVQLPAAPVYVHAPPMYGAPMYGAPVYVQPAPVYVQPRPIYVQPRPVYVQPRPVYVQPPPVYVSPPRYVYGDRRAWQHRHWQHDRDDRHDGHRGRGHDRD